MERVFKKKMKLFRYYGLFPHLYQAPKNWELNRIFVVNHERKKTNVGKGKMAIEPIWD